MKPILLSVLFCFASGCFFFRGSSMEAVPVEDIQKTPYDFVPPAADRFSYGPVHSTETGQWAVYRVVEEGQPDREIRIAVVAREHPGVWVDITVRSEQEHYLLSQWVDPEGRVHKSYYREPGQDVAEQGIEPAQVPPVSDWPRLEKEETGREEILVDQARLASDRVARTYITEEGQIFQELSWWSSQAFPLYASRDGKGLVRLTLGRKNVQLLRFGTGARPEVNVPRQ